MAPLLAGSGRCRLTLAAVIGLVLALGTATAAQARARSTGSAPVTKVLIVIEENHSYAQMRAGMPYTFSLAQQYGYATQYTAISHPSLPNYLAIAGGSTFGIADDKSPGAHPLPYQSIFGQAWATGHTAKTYVESAARNCDMKGSALYAVRHNPWLYFTPTSERALCQSDDVPFPAFPGDVAAGTLPTVGFVTPNLCNEAHNCSLATADAWFQKQMQQVFNGPDWLAGRLAVILTADEAGKGAATNNVLSVVIHPSQAGHVVATPLNHYSLTRLCEDVAHAPYLRNAATAPSLSDAFGLPIG